MPDPTLAVWQRDLPYRDPHDAAAAFADTPTLALLDSTGPITDAARYGFLGVDPFATLSHTGPDALTALRAAIAPYRLPPDPSPDAMPFRAGAIGLIGYEAGAATEPVPILPRAPSDPPDLAFGLYDLVIGFDRVRRLTRLHATGLPATTAAARAARAEARLDWAAARLAAPPAIPKPLPKLAWRADWTEAEYAARLTRLLAYIAAGDIFQANLTMRHRAPRPPNLDPWSLHAALRAANPAPFGVFLRCDSFTLSCSSPERFIRLTANGDLETRPIKGTIARAATPEADAQAAATLLASAKDRAENTMIVDVLRNDLGRVAAAHSITVPSLRALETYASVHHLVSTVRARLAPDCDAVDVLRAALPGGSITGAPKIRAMQIIAELEGVRRGPYCGSVVALGFDGAMDSNIVIRSFVLTAEEILVQSGGGIVADSTPAGEYAEMLLKSAMLRGLEGQGALPPAPPLGNLSPDSTC